MSIFVDTLSHTCTFKFLPVEGVYIKKNKFLVIISSMVCVWFSQDIWFESYSCRAKVYEMPSNLQKYRRFALFKKKNSYSIDVVF